MASNREDRVDLTVDARTLPCPLPVLRAKKGLNSLEVGQVLHITATDPGSLADFTAWTRSTGHELLWAEERQGEFSFGIRRLK